MISPMRQTTSTTHISIGDITAELTFKNIKHLHLRVQPPHGTVRISAPTHMGLDRVREFAVEKLDWIKRQQIKLQSQPRLAPREYVDHEPHFLWGQRYLLNVTEHSGPASIALNHDHILLSIRPGTGRDKREALVSAWYREQLRTAAMPLIAKWEPLIGRQITRLYVQQMKTRWGSCNPRRRSIRLNSELARKPRQCLEYVVVHELVHLIEPSHNKVFKRHMDDLMPQWRLFRAELNRLPIGYTDPTYQDFI